MGALNTCSECGREFGGSFAYSRHLDRRRDRCRSDAELLRRSLRLVDGVWRQRPPTGQRVLSGIHARGGSQLVEERRSNAVVGRNTLQALETAQSGPPQQKKAVSAE